MGRGCFAIDFNGVKAIGVIGIGAGFGADLNSGVADMGSICLVEAGVGFAGAATRGAMLLTGAGSSAGGGGRVTVAMTTEGGVGSGACLI